MYVYIRSSSQFIRSTPHPRAYKYIFRCGIHRNLTSTSASSKGIRETLSLPLSGSLSRASAGVISSLAMIVITRQARSLIITPSAPLNNYKRCGIILLLSSLVQSLAASPSLHGIWKKRAHACPDAAAAARVAHSRENCVSARAACARHVA